MSVLRRFFNLWRERSLVREFDEELRFHTQMRTFSATALALAIIGLYGLLTYFVKQRTQEIGLRVALGAERRHILLLILRQGVTLSMIGAAVGIAGGAVLTKSLQKMLFGISALDLGTFIAVPTTFIVVALAASYIPRSSGDKYRSRKISAIRIAEHRVEILLRPR